MNKARAAVQIPGERAQEENDDGAPTKTRATGDTLNNIIGTTANEVGAQHERTARAMAAAEAAKRGEEPNLAPAADIAVAAPARSSKRWATIGGERVEVEVPLIQRNAEVEKFGPESMLPKGTPVNKAGNRCEGSEEPYGVVGDINTPKGKLVNRIIPLEATA